MKVRRYHIVLDEEEQGIVIRSLNDERTELKENDKDTEAVDDVLLKIIEAPQKKFRVIERCRDEER